MVEPDGSRFEGMVLARLEDIAGRLEEVLQRLREIEGRCMTETGERAALTAEVRALCEKTRFHGRVIWGTVAWIIAAAAGALLALLTNGR